MPIYNIRCPHCKKSNEYIMSIHEDEIKCVNKKCKKMIERSCNIDYAKASAPTIIGTNCPKG